MHIYGYRQQKCRLQAAKMGESVFADRSVILTREVTMPGLSPDEEDLEDLGGDAGLYIFNCNQDVLQD